METTVVYRGSIGILEANMETAMVYWEYIRTTVQQELPRGREENLNSRPWRFFGN